MTVKEIRIPRFSMFNEEYELYLNLCEFLRLSEKLYRSKDSSASNSPPVCVLRELGNVAKLPYTFMQELFFALRDAAFSYQALPPMTSTEKNSKLFTTEMLTEWGKKKSDLKRLIKEHLDPVQKLRDCQKSWWQSYVKMNQYASMLEAAQVSLQYNTEDKNEYQARVLAIKGLKKDLASKQRKNARNVAKYEAALEVESKIRQEIIQVAESLKQSMTDRIKEKLQTAVDQLQTVSTSDCVVDLNVHRITNSIYAVTSGKYRFEEPSSDLSSNFIIRPSVHESNYEPTDDNSRYALCNYTGTVEDDCLTFTQDHLKLKPGDTVKLKIISQGGQTGFGWTRPSKFSIKKWGFFPTTNVNFTTDKSYG